SLRRRRPIEADRVVSRRSSCPGSRLRRGFDPAERDAFAPTASMGRLLAGDGSVGSTANGRFLASGAAALARGNGLAERPEDLGRLSADLSGQRVAASPALVRAQRD